MTIMAPAFYLAWLEKTTKIKKHLSYAIYIPAIMNTVVTILTIQTNWLGYINEENIYVRGPLFNCVLIVCMFYLVYTMGLIFKYRKQMVKRHLYVTSVIGAVICIAVELQINEQSMLTIWSTIGILCVCGYIFIIYYNWMHDELTGVENRTSYTQYIKQLENHNEIKIVKELDQVNKAITQFNLENKKGYELKFSYGISVYQKHKESMAEFLARVDWMMYEQKNKRKNKLM